MGPLAGDVWCKDPSQSNEEGEAQAYFFLGLAVYVYGYGGRQEEGIRVRNAVYAEMESVCALL